MRWRSVRGCSRQFLLQVVSGHGRGRAPLKSCETLKRLQRYVLQHAGEQMAENADPMCHLGLDSEPGLSVSAAVCPDEKLSRRGERLRRAALRESDRELLVPTGALHSGHF